MPNATTTAAAVVSPSSPLPTGLDADACYRAIASRDARFDGRFVVGVTTTGIYCRPSCPVPVRPKRANTRFFVTAAGAHDAGFRACKRCAPDASPGSPDWDLRADLAARAMRLIADGTVEREGVPGVAARLAVSPRHLHRVLVREVGAAPLRLARAHRAVTARTLIETTDLPFGEIAFAAGFGSIRQFNDTVQAIYDRTPSELRTRAAARRARSRQQPPTDPQTVEVRLAVREPFAVGPLWRWLRATAIPGVEEVTDAAYRRTVRLPGGPGTVELRPAEGGVSARLVLTDLRDLRTAVARCRRMLDLDADPGAVDEVLGAAAGIGGLARTRRGIRVPATADGFEAALRTVLAQQVSTASARTIVARVVQRLGTPLPEPDGALTTLLPDAATVAASDPATLGLPARRAEALRTVATAVADGSLDLSVGADREDAHRRLLELPGIGPWTADVIVLRALHDPDVLPARDLALARTATALGVGGVLEHAAQAWSPWRSYAAHLLWDRVLEAGPPEGDHR